jgi:hypothetical protein
MTVDLIVFSVHVPRVHVLLCAAAGEVSDGVQRPGRPHLLPLRTTGQAGHALPHLNIFDE